MNRISLGYLFLLLILISGCASLKNFPFGEGTGKALSEHADQLEIKYYSVGCFYLQYGETAVLSEPFWSHISLGQLLSGPVESDSSQVDPFLPPLDKVDAVVIGHGHHDHILDLPYVCPRMRKEIPILASQSVAHQYAACNFSQKIRPVNSILADPAHNGEWIWMEDSLLRILPIRSGHPPQLMGIHLYKGSHTEDLASPPSKAKDFQEGKTLAWLIDFMAPNQAGIAYRVYLQTSSTGWPAGFFPKSILDEKKVDAALLAMDCAIIKAKGKRPSIIDFLDPGQVIFCHWEDFFKEKADGPKQNVKVKLWKLKKQLDEEIEGKYVVPAWNGVFQF